MAHESSNPKVAAMFVVAIVSLGALVVFEQTFKSYYSMMMDEEEYAKVLGVPATQLADLRKAEETRLTSAPVPIERAMKELAARGRESPALKDVAKTDITPQPSNDPGALTGWLLLAKDAGAAAAPTTAATGEQPAAGDAGPGAAAADAGSTAAAVMGDAGATTTATKDAGAAPPKPVVPEAGTH